MIGNDGQRVERPSRVTPRRMVIALVVVLLVLLASLWMWSITGVRSAGRGAGHEERRASSDVSAERSTGASRSPSDREGLTTPHAPTSSPSAESERHDESNERVVEREAPSEPPRVPPTHEPSPRSDVPADVTFENTCSVPIELFWVDFDGALRWYGYVGRGSVVTQSSFEGHRWIARPRGETRELLTSVAGEGSTHVEACPSGDPLRDASPPPDVPPGGTPRHCTTEGGASMNLVWTNTCDAPIEMLWIDFTCERRPYTTLAPGQTRTQQTFVGHVWRAEDPSGRVLFERPADAAEAHWILRCEGTSGFGAAP